MMHYLLKNTRFMQLMYVEDSLYITWYSSAYNNKQRALIILNTKCLWYSYVFLSPITFINIINKTGREVLFFYLISTHRRSDVCVCWHLTRTWKHAMRDRLEIRPPTEFSSSSGKPKCIKVKVHMYIPCSMFTLSLTQTNLRVHAFSPYYYFVTVDK
jgi:hypothetical protein